MFLRLSKIMMTLVIGEHNPWCAGGQQGDAGVAAARRGARTEDLHLQEDVVPGLQVTLQIG